MQNSASLRRDKQLHELLDGKHFKQALSLCEKSLKKGDKSEQLLITKVNILLAYPEEARRQQGRRELNEILSRPHPISDIEALTTLNDAAQERKDKESRLQTIWERAVGVRPHDEDLYVRWFKTKFSERKWNAAQKAAMMYMKKFPKKREPFFWNIVTCELAGTDELSSELDQKILRPLAYGFLSKAAADVPVNKSTTTHARVLNTLEDLLLLLKVFRSQEKYSEALKILDDPLTGVSSRLGQNSWELVRHKVELYELCHRWDEEWEFCRELLEDAHPDNLQNASRSPKHQFGAFGDDWIVWVGLLSATAQIKIAEKSISTEQLIEKYIKSNRVSRNAQLALVRYSAASLDNENAQDALVSVCYEYFLRYGANFSCFRDLQPYVFHLGNQYKEKLIRNVAQHTRRLALDEKASQAKTLEWITSEINALRLDYYLIVSCEGNSDTPVPLFRAFVRSCLRLYRVALSMNITLPISERHPGDDAGILAVMGLTRLSRYGDRHARLQCIAVLEFLISSSKHNYDALLILVRLYMRLGAGSLAIQLYSRLSIKNLQHATISWVLFTRISSIHPFAPSRRDPTQTPTDSVKSLSIAIDWHKSAERFSSATVSQMLENGQYSMLFETLAVDKTIRASFAKFMFIVESHRIGRLMQFSGIKDYSSLLDELPRETEDMRDATAFPDAEAANQANFHEYLEPGAHSVNDHWLGMEIRIIELWKFLQTKNGDLATTPGTLMMECNRSKPESLTVMECEMTAVIDMLRMICDIYRCKPQRNDGIRKIKDAVKDMVQDLDDWQTAMVDSWQGQMLKNSRILDWEYFHVVFLFLDLNQLTIHTLDYVLKENLEQRLLDQHDLETSSKHIRKSINELCVNINQVTSEKLDMFSLPGFPDQLIQDAFGHSEEDENIIGLDLKDLIGMPKLQEIASDICSSWREALEGVMRTKFK